MRRWLGTILANALVVLGIAGIVTPGNDAARAVGSTSAEIAIAVAAQLDNASGVYRVSVREIDGANRSFNLNADYEMEPASSIKIFYAWLALRRADAGRLDLGSRLPSGVTWGRCIEVMIVVSDNLCSSDIREALGNRWVNRALVNAGFSHTHILLTSAGKYLGKRSSAGDLTDFLVRLERGELLSAESTDHLHRLLRDQVWRSRVGGGTPPGVVVESKPGQLAVNSRMVETDASIVRGPYSTYVITVMGENNATKSAIRSVSQIVYEGLQGVSVITRASYPRAQFTARRGARLSSQYGSVSSTRVRAGTSVRLKYTSRLDAYVHVDGLGWGWMRYSSLRLSDAYIVTH